MGGMVLYPLHAVSEGDERSNVSKFLNIFFNQIQIFIAIFGFSMKVHSIEYKQAWFWFSGSWDIPLWLKENVKFSTSVLILPFYNRSAPARLHVPVPHVSTKPLKSSLSLHAKILFYIWNEQIKYCNRYYYEVNWSVFTCKLLMSVYLDIKSLYQHLKVNWNVLMCKICIARHLVVDIFLWCNANFGPFPSGTLVACQMRNGRIVTSMFGIKGLFFFLFFVVYRFSHSNH